MASVVRALSRHGGRSSSGTAMRSAGEEPAAIRKEN